MSLVRIIRLMFTLYNITACMLVLVRLARHMRIIDICKQFSFNCFVKYNLHAHIRSFSSNSWFAISLSGYGGQCQPPTPAGSNNGINDIFFCVIPPTWPPRRQMQTINCTCSLLSSKYIRHQANEDMSEGMSIGYILNNSINHFNIKETFLSFSILRRLR